MEMSRIKIMVNIDTADLAIQDLDTRKVYELTIGKRITTPQLYKYATSREYINLKEIVECALADPDNFDENFYCKIHTRFLNCVDKKHSRTVDIDTLKRLMGNHFVRMSNDEFISKTRDYFRKGIYEFVPTIFPNVLFHVDIKDGDMIFSMK